MTGREQHATQVLPVYGRVAAMLALLAGFLFDYDSTCMLGLITVMLHAVWEAQKLPTGFGSQR
jgi:hypothetical protein